MAPPAVGMVETPQAANLYRTRGRLHLTILKELKASPPK